MEFNQKNIDQAIENLTSLRKSAVTQYAEISTGDEQLDAELADESEIGRKIEFFKNSQYLLKLAIDCLVGIQIAGKPRWHIKI